MYIKVCHFFLFRTLKMSLVLYNNNRCGQVALARNAVSQSMSPFRGFRINKCKRCLIKVVFS